MNMMQTRRTTLAWLAAGGPLAAFGADALAQDAFPSRPIQIVVPYPAGGTTDQLARAVAVQMGRTLGQPVVVENKAGAAGLIGADYVAKRPGDGYTLLFGNSGPNATAALMRDLPYDIHKDFRPLCGVVKVPMILAIPASLPYRSVSDFVAWARAQGTSLNYGSTGAGGSSNLISEYFNELAGTRIQHVPYKGGAPLVAALAAGEIQMAFLTGLDGAAMLQAGKIRYLGVGTPKRTDILPGLPAIAESVPGFNTVVWFGMLAPASVPDAIADKLARTLAAAVQDAEVRKGFIARNVEPWGSTPAELRQMIEAELAQFGPIVKKANIKLG